MPIYELDNSAFDVTLALLQKDAFVTELSNFTHVCKIPVNFVSQNGSGINEWVDYSILNSEINATPLITSTTTKNEIYEGVDFQPDKDEDKSFSDFLIGDISTQMYENDFDAFITTTKDLFNTKMSNVIFSQSVYDKLLASFNIEDGFDKSDGFGFIGSRVVNNESIKDDVGDRKLAIIFYQATGIPAQASGVY
jgi:hypothetical protein